jgi:dTDP-glucose pyrophosphorylase
VRDCSGVSIPPQATVRETLAVMDRGAMEIVLVVEEGRLLGTVTDGDVRRALLGSATLDSRIAEVMNRNFSAVETSTPPESMLQLMLARSIKQVPVVDSHGRVLGLYLLQDLVETKPARPNWAVVMAGGRGRRLEPLTQSTPKPMLSVGNQPLLHHIIDQLVGYGFRNLYIALHYLGDQIEDYFGDGVRFGCRIRYLRETDPLGTAGALSLLPELPEDPLLVVNGDLVTDINYSALLDFHRQQNHDATLCVREFHYRVPYGVVALDQTRITGIEEKPLHRFFISAGITVLNAEVLSHLPREGPVQMPELLEKARLAGKSVGAFPVQEYWLDMGQMEDYLKVRSQFPVRNNE